MTDTDLVGRPAVELARLLQTGEASAREVVQAHLDQLQLVDGQVNAVVTRTAEAALARAAALDEVFTRRGPVGPLHGVPVAHKDLADTRGVRTTYGSAIFADHVPQVDSVHVERMAAAGAVSLGKTNTPEFGAGSQTFNAIFGATRNPYDLGKTSGGSSGGAAAALAARSIALADGSDMGGSLRNPASFCNVVGLRPAPGRVPAWPAGDPWSPLSVVGPMGRTVRDVALLLGVLSGPDRRAALALDAYLPGSLDRPDMAGLRLAWSADLGGLPVDPRVAAVLAGGRRVLDGLGATVLDDEPDLTGADEAFDTLRAVAFAAAYAPLLRRRDELKDTVVWNIEQGLALRGEQLARAVRLRGRVYERARAFFERYDVLCAPTSQVPPFDVAVDWPREVAGQPMSSYTEWMRSCSRVTVTGLPAMSVPCGFTADGLPVGLQLVGPPRGEHRLLAVAAAFEDATGHWRRAPG